MASTSSDTQSLPIPIVFCYPESVFSTRLTRYLDLRRLPYVSVRVSPNMPRPILKRLSINHRRIPILAIGRDIYIDTRLIMSKFDTLFPDSPEHPSLKARDAFGQGVERLLDGWSYGAGPFWRAAGTLPVQAPLLRSDEWMKDRAEGSGGAFTAETQAENRAWGLSQLRLYFEIVEDLLADRREWVLGGDSGPGLADLHIWPIDWVIHIAEDMFVADDEIEEAMKDVNEVLGEQKFPKIHAWSRRFRAHVEKTAKANTAKKIAGQGVEVENEIVSDILGGRLAEGSELAFDKDDVLGLKKGQRISIGPADFGFTHADVGKLVGISENEIVIEIEAQGAKDGKLRIHFPRLDFKIKSVDNEANS